MALELNKIYNEDCLETMAKMPNNFVDLTVTSPPYDNLRNYNGYTFEFESIAKELFRVIKKGGVVVWIVNDATINGSETCTSFKQALFFRENCGFNLHDTMIYKKDVLPFPEQNRYNQCFEYMFVLSKEKPNTFNPIKKKTIGYKPSKTSTTRNCDGSTSTLKSEQGKDERNRFNIFEYNVGYMKSTSDIIAFQQPAIFPEMLAVDHIKSWSNENDLIYDPFMGSGTTGKMAFLLNRNYIGSEISEEYCKLAEKRLKIYTSQLRCF